eukprot:CAMPEP_0117664374 /NCGR_PEP_ID=MMETSP0804-20121206/9183_1 /TAXON_ID=1074897 /ORGANISM="Tetraselmis astigmatica, Strain CCMP880" /LENGTH=104 /DNA_ID=CAMNT_0005471597 /DNA_START=91 /DNA_END=402 /DNA_ORIENTATION=+
MSRYAQARSIVDAIYPHRFMPGKSEITAAAAWGGVAGFGLIFLVQPWGWIKDQISPPKETDASACLKHKGGTLLSSQAIIFLAHSIPRPPKERFVCLLCAYTAR